MRMKIQNQAIVGNNCRDHSVTAPLANCFCPSPHTCDITPIVISIYDREVDMTSAECGAQSREAWDVFLVLGTSERSRVFEKDCSL